MKTVSHLKKIFELAKRKSKLDPISIAFINKLEEDIESNIINYVVFEAAALITEDMISLIKYAKGISSTKVISIDMIKDRVESYFLEQGYISEWTKNRTFLKISMKDF